MISGMQLGQEILFGGRRFRLVLNVMLFFQLVVCLLRGEIVIVQLATLMTLVATFLGHKVFHLGRGGEWLLVLALGMDSVRNVVVGGNVSEFLVGLAAVDRIGNFWGMGRFLVLVLIRRKIILVVMVCGVGKL